MSRSAISGRALHHCCPPGADLKSLCWSCPCRDGQQQLCPGCVPGCPAGLSAGSSAFWGIRVLADGLAAVICTSWHRQNL